MKNTIIEVSLGLNFSLPQFESVQEFDTAAKRQGAALEYANAELTYRNTLPQMWRQLDELVQAKTKLAPKTKPHPEKTGVAVRDEAPRAYFGRCIAAGAITLDEIQKLADGISAKSIKRADGTAYGIVIDLTDAPKSERSTAPTKGDLATVVELRKHPQFATKLANLAKKTSTTLTPASSDDDIARALSTLRRAIDRELKAAAAAKLAASI